MNGETEILIKCSHQCTFHTDRSNPLFYDALIFHGRDVQAPPPKRTASQVYIIVTNESPVYRENYFIKGGDFYNWSATYSRKSDIVLPNLYLERKVWPNPDDRFIPKLPQMGSNRRFGEAMIAWVVSNCKTYSQREQYVNLLKGYIEVDVFGKCGRPCYKNLKLNGLACFETLAQTGNYKFYLAFENSACVDYITEKAVRALKVGLVPIVYGGRDAKEYLDKLPPNSFMDVRDFSSPKDLAIHLSYLDKNDTAYMAYHTWRLDYQLIGYKLPSRHTMCEVCKALHNRSMVGTPKSIDWGRIWNPETECDSNLFNKVKGSQT